MNPFRAIPFGYWIALVATMCVLVLRWLLSPFLGTEVPLALFLLAVIFAGFAGGFGPGMLATLLGVFAGTYFFLSPALSLQIDSLDQQLGIAVFIVEGVLISGLSEAFRLANERAIARMSLQHEAESQAISILNSTTDCYYALDADWRFTFVNPQAEAFLSQDAGALIGRDFWEIYPAAIGTDYERHCRLAMTSRAPIHFEGFSVIQPDRWLEVRAFPSKQGLSIFFRDITEQREARAAIAASEEQLQLITDAIPALVCYIDANFRYQFNNAAYERWFGYRRADLRGKDIREVIGAEGFAKVAPQIEAALRGEASSFDTVIHYKDGKTRDINISYMPHRGHEGNVLGVVALIADITDRKRSEEALRESDARLRFALHTAELGDWDLDLTTHEIRGSLKHSQIFGYALPDEQWSFDRLIDHLHPDDRRTVLDGFERAMVTGEDWTFEARIRRPDGEQRWIWASGCAFARQGEPPSRMLGLVTDITDRKQRESQQQFLVDLNDLLRSVGRPEEILQAVVNASGRYFGVTRCAYGELDESGEYLSLFRDFAGDVAPLAGNYRVADFGAKLFAELRRGNTVVIDNCTDDPRTRDFSGAFLAIQTRGLLIVPLVKEGKLMAIFTLLDKSHRDWSAGEIDLAEQIADRTWLAVENARSETALRASEERFRNLANSAPVFVWLSGVDKRCYWFNKPWLDFTGRTLEEEIGHGWLAAVHPDDRAMCEKAYQTDIEDRLRFTIEYRFRGRDGEYHWLLDNGIPLYSVSGVFTGYIGSRIDITERKRSEEERESLLASERSARAEAEQASRMKDEFLSTLSHELRTPLNAILGWTTVLRTGRVSPEDRDKGLEVIDRNVRIQARLIEDLLDMSRIISGKLRLDVQQIKLSNVVAAAVESIHPASEAKQIRLIKILDTKNDIVYGDASRLQQVVWNLLSNAIKFTPKEGKVTVILERVDSHLEVSVSDSGEGITPEFLPVIFERFRQLDGSTTRRHGGLGLGLSIVKQLVELHGGTVRASSPGLGRGATFTVTLPLAILSSAEASQPHPDGKPDGSLDSPRLDGIKVLVVDDEPDARELVRRLISDQSASVETASTADEALAILQQFHPDVLVSDIGMPDKDGYQLIREIRKLAPNEGGATPAAALTAFARSEDRRRALIAGYQTHVTKPVDPAELITIIASLAGRTGPAAGCDSPA